MTVCKFWAQGYCRYGDRCRFEHVDPDQSNYGHQRGPPRNAGYNQQSGGYRNQQGGGYGNQQYSQQNRYSGRYDNQQNYQQYNRAKSPGFSQGQSTGGGGSGFSFTKALQEASGPVSQSGFGNRSSSGFQSPSSGGFSFTRALNEVQPQQQQQYHPHQQQYPQQSALPSSQFGAFGSQPNFGSRPHLFSVPDVLSNSQFVQPAQGFAPSPFSSPSPSMFTPQPQMSNFGSSSFPAPIASQPQIQEVEFEDTAKQSNSVQYPTPQAPGSHEAPKDTSKVDASPLDPCIIYSNENQLTEQEISQYRAKEFTFGMIPIRPPPQNLCY